MQLHKADIYHLAFPIKKSAYSAIRKTSIITHLYTSLIWIEHFHILLEVLGVKNSSIVKSPDQLQKSIINR